MRGFETSGGLRALALLAALGALGSGCAAMDRESYSLVLRKKAHRYREPSSIEKRLLEESRPRTDPLPPAPSLEEPAPEGGPRGPALPPEILRVELEAFQPFAWCHHHESFHLLESLAAVAAAPVEYSAALTLHTALVSVRAGIDGIRELLGLPPRKREEEEDPPDPAEKKIPRPSK